MSRLNITPKRVKVTTSKLATSYGASPATVAKMAKLKTAKVKAPKVSKAKPSTVNVAGGESYNLSLRSEIVTGVLNCMLKGGFYKDANGELAQIQALVERADKAGDLEFVAKLALYARHVHGLRSVSHVLAGELGDRARGVPWKRPFYHNIVFRPDDLTEILAYWNHRHQGFRHPNAMTRGFATRLASFDAYRLAKYRGDGKQVSMIDAVNICHPRVPKKHPIHDLMKGKLAAADTWESAMSKAGNVDVNGDRDETKEEAVAEAKGAEWARLLSEGKIGYLACLRNLRNLAEQASDEAIDIAAALLMDAKQVAKCKVFPFQFRMAYKTLREASIANDRRALLVGAIARAADLALGNVPVFDGKTLVVVDDSGSMTSGGSGDETPIKIASVFAAALIKANPRADYMQFSDIARYLQPDTVGMGVFALAQHIEATCKSGGTNFTAIFEKARHGYDRVIILSDMQGWMQGGTQAAFASYAKRSGKAPFLYSFDLAGHGTSMFPEKQVCLIAGFSDKVFDTMGNVERDPAALVNEIAAIDIIKGIKTNG